MTEERENNNVAAGASTHRDEVGSKFGHLIHSENLLHESICKAIQENCAKYQATRNSKYLNDIVRDINEAQELITKREHAFAELKSSFCCKETASPAEIEQALEHCKTLWSRDTRISRMMSTGKLNAEALWEFALTWRGAPAADPPSMHMNQYRYLLTHFCSIHRTNLTEFMDTDEVINALCKHYDKLASEEQDRDMV